MTGLNTKVNVCKASVGWHAVCLFKEQGAQTMNDNLKDKVLNSDSVHNFTKDIIKQGLTKDLVDAYYDCKLVLEILKEHMDSVLNQ